MNLKIKRIIAMVLAVSAMGVLEPTKYFKPILTEEVNATSDDRTYLESIKVSKGTLNFSKKKTSYTVKVNNSTEKVTITVKAADSSDEVTIDGEEMTLNSDNKAEKEVRVKRGDNRIKVKVKNSETGNNTYTINFEKASSSSTSDKSGNSETYLDNIYLSDGTINFSKKTLTYYVAVDNSVDEIRVKAQPDYDDSQVEIDGTIVDEDDNYRTTVLLSHGKNEIKIVVEDEDGDYQRVYTLYIYRGTSIPSNVKVETAADDEDESSDAIYLDDIVINDGDIPLTFKPKTNSYDIELKESIDNIIIKAEPENSGDNVRINGDLTDTYRKRIYLDNGKNTIKIKVDNKDNYDEDDDEDYQERVYTVNVYRGTKAESNSTSSNNTTTEKNETIVNSTDLKVNQWVQNNGKWQFNDMLGQALKNTWYTDKNNGNTYYLQPDGYMATGWIYKDNSWYYLNNSGARQYGWVSLGGTWYYLDNEGKMKTGWQNINGKWYFLYDSGVMASNTKIDGYQLSSNGSMI